MSILSFQLRGAYFDKERMFQIWKGLGGKAEEMEEKGKVTVLHVA